MSREMNELAPLLLAPSSFEDRFGLNQARARDGLAKLSSLAALTAGSVAPVPPAAASLAAPPSAAGEVRPSESAPAPLPPADYESRTQDYRPALQDRSIVDALLDFHRKSFSAASPPLSGFRPQRLPQVAAEPKPGTPAARPKVFRPR